MKRRLLGFGSVAIFVAVFCLFNINEANAKTLLKLQAVYPLKSAAAQSYQFFAEKVEEYTNGDVKIKVFAPRQLVGFKEAFTALQRGVVDAIGAASHNYAGSMPEANGPQIPYIWNGPAEAMELYFKYGFMDIMREAAKKRGVYDVGTMCYGTNGLMSKFPIHKLEDLKGKKIRTGGLQSEIITLWGAAPANVSGTEQYVALQRGTIDGTIYAFYAAQTYGFGDVISDVMLPGLYTPTFASGILFNLKVWDKFSPENKAAIERAGIETMWRSIVFTQIAEKRAMEYFQRKGVKVNALSPKEFERFKKAALPVLESHAKKSDLCAKQVQIIKKFWKDKGR